MSDAAYEDRIVAFLDILGFSAVIDSSKSNEGIVPQIANVLHNLETYAPHLSEVNEHGETPIEFRSSLMSDSIVISVSANNLLGLVVLVQVVTLDLLFKGRLLRGGIAEGRLYHRNNVVFGPALVAAYDLERRNAIYPRVVLQPGLVERQKGRMVSASEVGPVNLVDRDRDGLFFVKLGSMFAGSVLAGIAERLRLLAQATGGVSERMKVLWAIDEWNKKLVSAGQSVLLPEELSYMGIDLFQELSSLPPRTFTTTPPPKIAMKTEAK